jgi:hypothetical protein
MEPDDARHAGIGRLREAKLFLPLTLFTVIPAPWQLFRAEPASLGGTVRPWRHGAAGQAEVPAAGAP